MVFFELMNSLKILEKICSRCTRHLDVSFYRLSKTSADGLQSRCLWCERTAKGVAALPKPISYTAEQRAEMALRIAEAVKLAAERLKRKADEQGRPVRGASDQPRKALTDRQVARFRDAILVKLLPLDQQHAEREFLCKLRQSRADRARRQTDPIYAMTIRIRSNIATALRRGSTIKSERTEKILGCTFQEFFRHLELQFLPGMSWENRDLWHVDHIVPLSSAKTEADVLALNHFTNLRPYWAGPNLAKGATVTHLI